MEENVSVSDQITAFIKKNLLFVVLSVVGVVFIGIGLFQYLSPKDNSVEFTSQSQVEAKDVKGATTEVSKISVDIEGQVQKPGVYVLPEGARLEDTIVASGGLSGTADRTYVSKSLNLAQKLTDGAKIYIPAVGEISSPNGVSIAGLSTLGDSSGLTDINSATEAKLDTLPKVGVVTAQKIINGRPYGTIQDLVSKKVLTQKTFDGLKDKITAQ